INWWTSHTLPSARAQPHHNKSAPERKRNIKMTTKKADYIWFNGEMVRWEDAKVHVMSHALHYGTSVFEGIRCYDSHKGPVVFRHREHMQRLHDSAKIYRFPVSQSIDELMEACRDVIRKNNLTSAYIRSEEHTSELQSRFDLVCRLLLEKKKKRKTRDRL